MERCIKMNQQNDEKHHVLPPGVCYPYGERGEVYLPEARRNEGIRSKNERSILAKELRMARVFAKSGYKIVFTENGANNHDVFIDGVAADLKRLESHNHIVRHAKHATRNQGAELVLFEFTKETKEIYTELEKLTRRDIHGKYFFSGNHAVYDF